MHIDDDIIFNLNTNDGSGGSTGGYYYIPAEPFNLIAVEIVAQRKSL